MIHECPRCGTRLSSMAVHPDDACERQRRINDRNRSIRDQAECPWCAAGYLADHREGCPREGYNR